MANRFFTILVIPEKTSQVRRIVLPSWLVKGSVFGLLFAGILAGIMLLDYWYVMSQISENKQLKLENRRLRQQVQIFKNKMTTIESTMDRVKSFATRLKVITNIEDRGSLLQSLNNRKLPDADTNIRQTGAATAAATNPAQSSTQAQPPVFGPQIDSESKENAVANPFAGSAADATPAGSSAPAGPLSDASTSSAASPEDVLLRKEYEELDAQFSEINHETLLVETLLQDQYELLADQKAFLAALPTRKPAIGFYTSGFGVRRNPTNDRIKIHEGLDIANSPGTKIRAPADGVVAWADIKGGYGKTVILDHGYGLKTWYAHTREILVNKGQRVHRGDYIAKLGNTGRSTGPHLHYEVRINDIPVDPLTYILEDH